MDMFVEVVNEEFGDATIHKVIRSNQRGDFVLDTKPRVYLELVSAWWGEEKLCHKNKEGKFEWVDCYIKTSKTHIMGYARQVAQPTEQVDTQ